MHFSLRAWVAGGRVGGSSCHFYQLPSKPPQINMPYKLKQSACYVNAALRPFLSNPLPDWECPSALWVEISEPPLVPAYRSSFIPLARSLLSSQAEQLYKINIPLG